MCWPGNQVICLGGLCLIGSAERRHCSYCTFLVVVVYAFQGVLFVLPVCSNLPPLRCFLSRIWAWLPPVVTAPAFWVCIIVRVDVPAAVAQSVCSALFVWGHILRLLCVVVFGLQCLSPWVFNRPGVAGAVLQTAL